jgi:uncharacterized protein with PIN domain
VKIRISEEGLIHCPGCDAIMKKLYWKQRSVYEEIKTVFTEWYGCTDCGKYVYDKHEDVVLLQFKKGEE